jgi:hypothetical protein
VLYTGDYSCDEDRHLTGAEVPALAPSLSLTALTGAINGTTTASGGVSGSGGGGVAPPDVLIVEATHGIQCLETRAERERRFCDAVEKVVRRGGKCLIPVFALGRAQELLLILEELWARKPHLQSVPMYHASRLATASLGVYKAFVGHMTPALQAAVSSGRNPWDFRHIRNIRGTIEDFREPHGPCVVIAAPGMLQSGFSRQLFDRWCEDGRNGVILAGYSTENTLARRLEANPAEVDTLSNRRVPRRMGIDRISFSAHADYRQTSAFLDALRPRAVVLVHGERTEMLRLHKKLTVDKRLQCHMPPNLRTLGLALPERRVVRSLGALARDSQLRLLRAEGEAAAAQQASQPPSVRVSGFLVKRHFDYFLMSSEDLPHFTPLTTHALLQRQHVPYRAGLPLLKAFAAALFGAVDEEVEAVDGASGAVLLRGQRAERARARHLQRTANHAAAGAIADGGKAEQDTHDADEALPPGHRFRSVLVVARSIRITHAPPDRIVLEWNAAPLADTVADTLVSLISQAEVSRASVAMHTSGAPCSHSHSHAHADGACTPGHAQGAVDGDASPGGGARRAKKARLDIVEVDSVADGAPAVAAVAADPRKRRNLASTAAVPVTMSSTDSAITEAEVADAGADAVAAADETEAVYCEECELEQQTAISPAAAAARFIRLCQRQAEHQLQEGATPLVGPKDVDETEGALVSSDGDALGTATSASMPPAAQLLLSSDGSPLADVYTPGLLLPAAAIHPFFLSAEEGGEDAQVFIPADDSPYPLPARLVRRRDQLLDVLAQKCGPLALYYCGTDEDLVAESIGCWTQSFLETQIDADADQHAEAEAEAADGQTTAGITALVILEDGRRTLASRAERRRVLQYLHFQLEETRSQAQHGCFAIGLVSNGQVGVLLCLLGQTAPGSPAMPNAGSYRVFVRPLAQVTASPAADAALASKTEAAALVALGFASSIEHAAISLPALTAVRQEAEKAIATQLRLILGEAVRMAETACRPVFAKAADA